MRRGSLPYYNDQPDLTGYLLVDGSKPLTADWDVGSFKITAEQFESDIATGTAPLIVASSTLVANLNADLLDGVEGNTLLSKSGGDMTGAITMATGAGNGIKWGDGDSEIYESIDDYIDIKVAGASRFQFISSGLRGTTGGMGIFNAIISTSTVPAFSPNRADTNTGLGWNGNDEGSLIGGGVESARFTANQFETKIGVSRNITTVNAATYDLLTTDYILDVTYTPTGAVTSLTIPTAQFAKGRVFCVKDGGGNATTNNITIDTEGSQTIDGSPTYVINGDYDYAWFYCDGTNLRVMG